MQIENIERLINTLLILTQSQICAHCKIKKTMILTSLDLIQSFLPGYKIWLINIKQTLKLLCHYFYLFVYFYQHSSKMHEGT